MSHMESLQERKYRINISLQMFRAVAPTLA